MVAPKGSRLQLEFGAASAPPSGTGLVVNFTDARPPLGNVGVGRLGAVGQPVVRLRFRDVKPASIGDLAKIGLPRIERVSLRIAASGWDSSTVASPKYVSWRRFIGISGIEKPSQPAKPSLRLAGGYQPAPGSNIILNFAERLNPPPGSAVVLEFGAMGYGRVLGATVGNTQHFGAVIVARPESLRPAGIAPPALGRPSLELSNRQLRPLSIAHGQEFFGKPNLRLTAAVVNPSPFVATAFGSLRIWNWRQHVSSEGVASQVFGKPILLGGVKTVTLVGIDSLQFGSLKLVNTRADQAIAPTGMEPPAMGAVNVSPRILYPAGIRAWAVGLPVVQRNPNPLGWDSAVYGRPLVYFKSRFVRPPSVDSFVAGYPRVADWARRILHIASPVSSVFGDTTLRLKNYRVQVTQGVSPPPISDWSAVSNRNRRVVAIGITRGEAGHPAIKNKSPSIAPRGIDAMQFGVADAGVWVRYLRVRGIAPLDGAVPTPSLWQTPAIKPSGIAAPAIPEPSVLNAIRFLSGAGGSEHAAYGLPFVGYRYRHIGTQGSAASELGQPRLEHRDRGIDVSGIRQDAYGWTLLTLGRRSVAPGGIPTPESKGANHFVGGTRWLRPMGFEATRWGTRIIPEAQVLYPLGFAGTFGWPRVENRNQHIKPSTIRLYAEPQQYFGLGRVFNLRQIVSMFYDPDSGLNPPRWPQWTLIENRNRKLGATGWNASKVAAPRIENAARVLLPSGVPAPALPEWQKTGMVAYRARHLNLEGIEPLHISGWGNVRNAARLIKPVGAVTAAFGKARLENRSREFNRIGGWDSAWFGYPFVAPRIREVGFESRYAIAPPRIPLPTLQLHTRYVEPKGVEPKEVGRTSLEIHFNRITPRWTMVNYWGYPVIKNKTPELRQRGASMDEWGNASMRLQWRPVAPDGANMALLGKPIIADSRRTITVPGTNMLRIGDKLTVTKTGVPPLATQYIWLDSLDPINRPEDGNGIPAPGWPYSQVGTPSMQQQVIYPASVDPMTQWGRPTVTANSIRVEPGIFDLTVGEPMVSLKRRTLTVKGIEPRTDIGKPRVSPHTIYAVVEGTQQAKDNHPVPDLHLVRSWVEFGNPVVQNRHRTLGHGWSFDGMAFGMAALHNAKQYVYPVGRLMSRMGWPSFPGETRVEFYTTIDTMAVGIPSVARPPYVGPLYVTPAGLDATGFGQHRVEHFNRTVLAVGHDSAQLGTKDWDDSPYMWKGLRIGPLMPTIPEGFNAEAFGKTWVSHRVRQLTVEGFDAFRCEYDYQAFAQRMRVRHAALNERLPQIVKTHGRQSSTVGTPGVRLGVHYIRPDGNSDQYRKGVPQ